MQELKYYLDSYGIEKIEITEHTALKFLTEKQIDDLTKIQFLNNFSGLKKFKINGTMNEVYSHVIVSL